MVISIPLGMVGTNLYSFYKCRGGNTKKINL